VDGRIPPRFKDAKMADLDPMQFEGVSDYDGNLFGRVEGGYGLLLSGPPGVGKTYAVSALTNSAVARFRKKQKRFDYVFVTAPDFFDSITMFDNGAQSGVTIDDRRNQPWVITYGSVKWLVINDLGKEIRQGGLGEQVVAKLGRVLRARVENRLVTHITTNASLKGENGIEELYGKSIVSLLRESFHSFIITGADRRRRT
jgi:DNA replication protein DnaC